MESMLDEPPALVAPVVLLLAGFELARQLEEGGMIDYTLQDLEFPQESGCGCTFALSPISW
jgi:hypothetical protein